MTNQQRTILTAVVFTLSMAVLSFAGYVEAKSNARPLPTEPLFVPKADASGNCTSYGGDTKYESLSGVSLIPEPSGTYELEVQVFIANPGNCVPAEPCPAYDESPEYVNVWIDWNGDKTWDNSEQVMDTALSGYSSINYGGTMTATVQLLPPSAVTEEPTWLRANLGWDYDPNDPCETSWDWGDVADQLIRFKVPEIKDITAEGIGTTGNNNPQTGQTVRLEADLEIPTGYEIIKCLWEGDLVPSPTFGDTANNCRADHTPAVGVGPSVNTYGEKTVKLTLAHKQKMSGATGQSSKQHNYKVFFDKVGDDDGNHRDNWYEYWGVNGAAPSLIGTFYKGGSYTGATWAQVFWYPPRPPTYEIYNRASMDCGIGTYAHNGFSITDHSKGIDCVEVTLAHERAHIQIIKNKFGGIWQGMVDTDGDKLPDAIENTMIGFNPNQAVSFPGYPTPLGNDEEVYCDVQALGSAGVASNDWANPGKQTIPAYASLSPTHKVASITPESKGQPLNTQAGNEGQRLKARISKESNGQRLSTPTYHKARVGGVIDGGTDAEFTGSYSDKGVDTDGDGKYDLLKIEIGLLVGDAGNYRIQGNLRNSKGHIISAEFLGFLPLGSNTVPLTFETDKLRMSRTDGPYMLSMLLLVGKEKLAFLRDVYTTNPYNYSDFDAPVVELNGKYAETVIDTDGDGLYNLLRINVDLDVQETGNYAVIGEFESSEDIITVVNETVSLSMGNQNIDLDFDGRLIFQHRKNGPYYLRKLRVEDAARKKLDFIYEVYTTGTYTYTQFQHGDVTIDADSYRDHGLDIDKDGDFDYLQVAFELNNAGQGGNYRVGADLVDSHGKTIGRKKVFFTLAAGNAFTVTLDFFGSEIYQHGVNGPYQVSRVSLMKTTGDSLDYQQTAHTTPAYKYTDFGPPLVSLTGNYQDYGQDTDNDGLYDSLVIEIGVLPDNDGLIFANARLVDRLGHQFEWATNRVKLTGGSEQQISLAFDGKLIRAHGVSGPYELRNLLVYQTGDPSQKAKVVLAHTTSAYSYKDFSATGSVLQFAAAGFSVGEDDGLATITVTRSGDAEGEVSVDYATFNGTAKADDDYIKISGSLTWHDGENGNQTFTVPIIDDDENEGAETVVLTLSKPTGGALLANPKVAALTIVEKSLSVTVIDDSFTATRSNGGVSLKWETGTERQNAGFFVLRGQLPTGKTECSDKPESYTEVRRISALLPAQGEGMSGALYSYEDKKVKSGETYCYALEDVEVDGNRTLHLEDIVSVTVE